MSFSQLVAHIFLFLFFFARIFPLISPLLELVAHILRQHFESGWGLRSSLWGTGDGGSNMLAFT